MLDDRELQYAQRVAILELKVNTIEAELIKIDGKIDELLALRSKGVGAFWLASALLGTGLLGMLVQVLKWIKVM